MLARTLRRPRCAIPSTTSSMPALDGLVEDGIEEGDGRLGALEAEALLADVAGVEEPLEGLGGVQPLEHVALLAGAERSGTPSTWSWIQRFWTGSWMCMYSMPIVRQ